MRQSTIYMLLLLCLSLTACNKGCSNQSNTPEIPKKQPHPNCKVEIAPNKWLDIELTAKSGSSGKLILDPHKMPGALQASMDSSSKSEKHDQGTSAIALIWNNKVINWTGSEIPITLRESNSNLYMVGFNREYLEKPKFVLFSINHDKTTFEEIQIKDFPKQVATQNMWLDVEPRYTETEHKTVDNWEVLRKLDVDSPSFWHSLTAKLWVYLETGKQYNEQESSIPQNALNEYMGKYKPIALPTIVKDAPLSPNLNVEVAPGKWLNIEIANSLYNVSKPSYTKSDAIEDAITLGLEAFDKDESTSRKKYSIRFKHGQVTAIWEGREIPICLRVHDGVVYLVTQNKNSKDYQAFSLYKLEPNRVQFTEITRDEFPKSIAFQNMNITRQADRSNQLQLLLDMDVTNKDFPSTLTAKLWLYLETGEQLYQQQKIPSPEFLEGYMLKNQPVLLQEIVQKSKK